MNLRYLLPSLSLAFGLGVNATHLSAQSGIGTITPDPNVGLHVKAPAGVGKDPLLLEGLRAGTTETDLIVKDASGKLRYRPVADLIPESEWVYNGTSHIYARRAQLGGNDIVVTNAGRFGIGSTLPEAAFHLAIGTDLVTPTGGGALRLGLGSGRYLAMDNNEIGAFTGTAVSPLLLNTYGGTVVIGQSNGAASLLDAYGSARVRVLGVGDVDNVGVDDQIVTADASGLLRKVPVTALKTLQEWRDSVVAGRDLIYAHQSRRAGNDVVVTDVGQIGIGTVAPATTLHVARGSLLLGNDIDGAYDPREDIRLSSGGTSDAIITTQDGSGRFVFKWNASYGTGETFLANNEHAVRMRLDGNPLVGDEVFEIQASSGVGNAGDPISWATHMRITNQGNVGFGAVTPTHTLDVGGKARVRTLDPGIITNTPATDDQLVTVTSAGELRKISAYGLFQQESEWVDHASGNYVYARRARDEGSTDHVVVDDDGRLGIGRTNPLHKIHITDGGIVTEGYTFGIGFNGANPYDAVANRDGGRVYPDQNFFGSNRDALVFEKTDFNHGDVDGGIAFTNRQATNNRTTSMVIRGNGNVGIGETAPLARLHVVGDVLFRANGTGNTGASEGLVRVVDYVGPQRPWATRGLQVADENDFAYFGLRDMGNGREDGVAMWGNNRDEDFRFIHLNGATETEVVHLDGQYANVGIGGVPVQNSLTKLDVFGRARVRDLFAVNGDVDGVGVDDRLVTTNANGDLQSVSATALFQDFEDDDWQIVGTNIYNKNSGNVGIGVTNPSFKLDIGGGDARLRTGSFLQFGDRAENNLRVTGDNNFNLQARTNLDFLGRNGSKVMTVHGTNYAVGIGTDNPNGTFGLDIDREVNLRQGRYMQFGSQGANRVYAAGDNDFRVQGRTRVSFRDRGDNTDVLTVRADIQRVGVMTDDPQRELDVNGRLRVRTMTQNNNLDRFLVVDGTNGDVHYRDLAAFEGPWVQVPGLPGRIYQRNLIDRVGIGTNNPQGALHVYEPTGTPAQAGRGSLTIEHGDAGGQSSLVFKSTSNANSDYGYISYADDGSGNGGSAENGLLEIGVGNDGIGGNQDDVAIMPTGRLGVKTRAPLSDLHVEGTARVTAMPLVNNTTDFAVTVDNAGELRRQALTSIRDNLGDHRMRNHLRTDGFAISYAGTDAGIKLTDQNSAMISGRLQVGNVVPSWIDDNITGISGNGFAGNDGAIFAPVRTGAEDSDLRLYILDNNNDAFSIWGNPCNTANCGSINNARQVAQFRADGQITLNDLAHGANVDRMVVVDGAGVLDWRPIPGGGGPSGGSGDNLGNHNATQTIRLNDNRITNDGGGADGFRINDDGNLLFDNGRTMFWNSIYSTAISGNVQANGEGGNSDLRFEADDDFYIQTKGNGGDLLGHIGGDVVIQADNYFRLTTGTASDDDFRFYTSSTSNNPSNTNYGTERFRIKNAGDVQVFNLAGAGNRIVTAAPDGTLQVMSGSSTGLWDRDAANAETFLTNNGDDVGIGTTDPDAALHVWRNGTAVEAELRLQNNNGAGDSRVRFVDGNNPVSQGQSIRYDGSDNKLYVESNNGSTQPYLTVEEGPGQIGIGTATPRTQLHVVRNTANAGAGAGLNNPARIRVQNESVQGSSGIEFVEGTGALGNNNGMNLRYHSSADGSYDALEIVRGDLEDANPANVKFAVERNSGRVTVNNLATGSVDRMVVADAAGVLKTRAFDAALWARDATNNELYPASLTDEIGIGTADPTAPLHVVGGVRLDGVQGVTAGPTDRIVTIGANGTLTSVDRNAFNSPWNRDGVGNVELANASDRVGIGVLPAAGHRLHVGMGGVRLDGLAGATTRLVVADANGSLATQSLAPYISHWTRNATTGDVSLLDPADQVGIGTAVPQAQLHTTGSVRLAGLATGGIGRIVMANAAGDLYTQAVPAELWVRNSTVTSLANAGDQVGIGTSAPAATTALDVNGRVRVATMDTELAGDRVVVIGADGILRRGAAGAYATPWIEHPVTDRVTLESNDRWVGIGTQAPGSVLHVEDQLPTMEMRLQNRQGTGAVQLRFRTGTNSGGFSDQNNSMTLRYSNSADALEITNGYVNSDINYASHFKVRRANGFVGINVGAANPAHQLHVDGNIGLYDGHRIQFEEANSYLTDNGGLAGDDDLILRAHDILYLRGGGNNGLRVESTGNIRLDNVPAGGTGDGILTLSGGGTNGIVRSLPFSSFQGPWTRNGSNVELATATDRVGIGAPSPDATVRLFVSGIARVSSLAGTGTGMVVADGNGNLLRSALPWVKGATGVALATAGDNVGIGTTTPSARLHAVGTVRLEGLPAGSVTDLLLTVDALGNVRRTALSTIGAGAQDLSLDPATNVLSLSGDATPVSLTPYLDNTDAQTLNLTGSTLTIAGGNSVDLSNGFTPSGWVATGTRTTLAVGTQDVGIGTAAPTARLHVNGAVRFEGLSGGVASDAVLSADASGNVRRMSMAQIDAATGLGNHLAAQNLRLGTFWLSGDGGNEGIQVANDGRVSIGAGGPVGANVLTVNGTANVSSRLTTSLFRMTTGATAGFVLASDALGNATWTAPGVITSDARLKTAVAPLSGILERLRDVAPVSYKYRADAPLATVAGDTATHYGVIAQDLAAAFPHAVQEIGGYFHIKERELTGILFAATQELRGENLALKAETARLAAELARLQAANLELARDVHGLSAETAEMKSTMTQVLRHIEAGKRIQAGEH